MWNDLDPEEKASVIADAQVIGILVVIAMIVFPLLVIGGWI